MTKKKSVVGKLFSIRRVFRDGMPMPSLFVIIHEYWLQKEV
jgi:hypothetical protein